MESAREPCFHCREAIALEAQVCPFCRREVLVDVRLARAVDDGRLRYKLARAVAALGPPLPGFMSLQQALAEPHPTVARRVSRAQAQAIVALLEAEELAAQVEPARVPQLVTATRAPVREGFPFAALAWGVVFVAALGGVGWYAWRIAYDVVHEAPAKAPAANRSVALDVAPATPEVPALTTRQVAERGLASTVSLRCQNSVASGFFVSPDTVLTNAHALCAMGAMRVVLSDGRQASGMAGRVDQTLDLATVTVYGAQGEAAPLGDAGALAVGEKVVIIGSPMGLEFTVHEGTVSSLARSIEGVAFIQLDAKINPGNSGGPLFDDRGRVVGVVSRKHSMAEGIGLALPINYAYRSVAPGARLASGAASSKGFEAMIARAKAEQIDEKRAEAGPLPERGLPMVVALSTDKRARQVVILVALPAQSRPEYRKLAFDVMIAEEVLCTVESEVYEWTLLEGNVALGRIHPQQLPSIRRRTALGTLYLGEARLSLDRCPQERLRWGQVLRLAGADPEFASVR